MNNRVCKLLGIRYPVIQGGMIHIATADLASAVSNAGGLGQISCGLDPEALRQEIKKTKELTGSAFAVNIPLVIPPWDLLEVVIEEQVGIVVTSAGNPGMIARHVKENRVLLLHVVSSVYQAAKCESAGVDIVIAEGWEAGGHNGRDDITTMTLVPQVCRAVSLPVVAAGGIADASGVAAAFALGAEGVQLGTRFAVSMECIAHSAYKEAVVRASDNGTVVTARGIDPVRMLKNRLSEEILAWEEQGVRGEELLNRIGAGLTYEALIEGNVERGTAMSGQVAGLIDRVLSVEEIFKLIIGEMETVLARVNSLSKMFSS